MTSLLQKIKQQHESNKKGRPPVVVLTHDPPLHRWSRGLSYLALVFSGITVFFIDVAFLQNLVAYSIMVIGIFLIVGGAVSGIGHFVKITILEMSGHALLLPSLAILVAVLFREAGENASRIFIGLLVLAFLLNMYGHFRDLLALYRVDRAMPREGKN